MQTLLHYKIYSTDTKKLSSPPPLIILHGLLGSMDNWRSQAKRFVQSRTVITIDLRNHGNSPHIKGMSYKEMATDIAAILEHEKLSEIDLLGHSMGGKVAMWLALHSPELVAKLIIVDIAPKVYPLWHQKVFSAMMRLPLAELKSRKEVDQYFAQLIEDDVERIFLSKNLQRCETGGYRWRCNLEEIARGYLKIAAFPLSTLVFPKSTLFIRGEHSHYITDKDYSLIKSVFTQSKIHTILNSGHLPHIEQFEAFYQLSVRFLNN